MDLYRSGGPRLEIIGTSQCGYHEHSWLYLVLIKPLHSHESLYVLRLVKESEDHQVEARKKQRWIRWNQDR